MKSTYHFSQASLKLESLGLELERDERLDALCAGRWIIQRAKGHRATSDDQLLAWRLSALWREEKPPRVLELGAGKGTVTLIHSAFASHAKYVGIESLSESYLLSLKNRRLNRLERRFTPLCGDLRDPSVIQRALEIYPEYDLICGAPPFMPLGAGVLPKDEQRARGRFEIKGGVEDYFRAIARCLSPRAESRGVILMDGKSHQRTLAALSTIPQLKLIRIIEVAPRPHLPPTYEIFEVAWQTPYDSHKPLSQPLPAIHHSRLNFRALEGEDWSDEYMKIRRRLGLSKPQFPLTFVPARLQSRRLPHKALLDIEGQPMIARVTERLLNLLPTDRLVIVSDDESVLSASLKTKCDSVAVRRLIVNEPCHSGSQRVLRAHETLLLRPPESKVEQSSWIINLQGDEPLIPLESLEALVESLPHFQRAGVKVVTLACPLPEGEELTSLAINNRSLVKVCLGDSKRPLGAAPFHQVTQAWREALYFTRHPVGTHQHIGVYAFHEEALDIIDRPRTPLATQEDLEQLTWLEEGLSIGVVCLHDAHPPGVDTEADLELVRAHVRAQSTES